MFSDGIAKVAPALTLTSGTANTAGCRMTKDAHELELMRLQAEQRSLTALRTVGQQALARQRELVGELESRPLYRAMHKSTNVGFVPYDQL